jgi:hypothetical protein
VSQKVSPHLECFLQHLDSHVCEQHKKLRKLPYTFRVFCALTELERDDLAKSSFESGVRVWTPDETLLDLWLRPKKPPELEWLTIPGYEEISDDMARMGLRYRRALPVVDDCASFIELSRMIFAMYDAGYCAWRRGPKDELEWCITEWGRRDYLAKPDVAVRSLVEGLMRRSERIFGQ